MGQPVFVALGSNVEPETHLVKAVRLLSGRVTLVRVSRVYRTAPVGSTGQPDFLNAAVLVDTNLVPRDLKFDVLRAIEHELGRVRGGDKFAARTIDLDIALFGDRVIDDPAGGLILPDPAVLTQAHVALPLADLDPAFVHPLSGETLSQIATRLAKTVDVQLVDLNLAPL